MVAHGDSPLSQLQMLPSLLTVLGLEYGGWEFRSIISSTSFRLASGEISISEAGDTFSPLLRAHLERFDLVKPCQERGGTKDILRRTRRIERAAEQLRVEKNQSRKFRRQDSSGFNNLVSAQASEGVSCFILK